MIFVEKHGMLYLRNSMGRMRRYSVNPAAKKTDKRERGFCLKLKLAEEDEVCYVISLMNFEESSFAFL